MNTDNLRKFSALKQRISETEALAKELRAEATELEQHILDDFADEGVNKISVDGQTIYMRREIWARRPKEIDQEQMAQGLMGAGLDYLVSSKVNLQGLSAYARELDSAGEDLPSGLDRVVNVDEIFRLGVRRS
jgi:hypothetical protein